MKGRDLGYSNPMLSPRSSHEKWYMGSKGSHMAAPRGKKLEVCHASPRGSPRGSLIGSPELNQHYMGKPKGQNFYHRQNTQYRIKPHDLPKRSQGEYVERSEWECLAKEMGDIKYMIQGLMNQSNNSHDRNEAKGNCSKSPRAASPDKTDNPFVPGQQGTGSKEKNYKQW